MKLILTSFLLVLSVSLISQNAYIQVEAEPGISVFLDKSFEGKTTTEIGGLIIENVSAGTHSIKVLKDGFNPQEEKITIKAGEVYTYKVRPFIPKLKITETGNTGQQKIDLKVGKLKIQSLPISINISIPSLGVNSTKSKDEWNVEEVPVGTYPATFNGNNKTMSYTIEIKHNHLTHLFVNLINGKIEDRSRQIEDFTGSHFNKNITYGSFTDPRDGKIYKTVQIGKKIWMAENLAYLPSISPPDHGSNISPCYYVYGFKGTSVSAAKGTRNYKTCGVLYNWEAAKLSCPAGWHLSTDKEWKELEMRVGMSQSEAEDRGWRGTDECKKLKSKTGWKHDPHGYGIDIVGFSALPGGSRSTKGNFHSLVDNGYWWTSRYHQSNRAWNRELYYNFLEVTRYEFHATETGFSVRCIKD